MFVILGTKTAKSDIGVISNNIRCQNCNTDAQYKVVRVALWFSFFFIPIFPYSFEYYLVCTYCDCGHKITRKKAREILEGSKNTNESCSEQQIGTKADQQKTLDGNNVPDEIDYAGQYRIAAAGMVKAEIQIQLRTGLILGIFGLAFIILWKWVDGLFLMVSSLCIIMGGLAILAIPVQIMKTVYNSKRCPEKIECELGSIKLDNEKISANDITKAEMTSVRVSSTSLYPVQRYLRLITKSGRHCYWLGSTSSMPDKEYVVICRMIEHAFSQADRDLGKFKYSMKKWILPR